MTRWTSRSAPRRLLLAALILSALPLAAQATAPSLADALAQLDAEQASNYQGRPGARVRDAAEFERMKAYVRAHYEGVVARHHFEMSPGVVVDCVDELTQPGARRQGLTRADWVNRPSQLPVDPGAVDAAGMPALDQTPRDPGVFLSRQAPERDADGQLMSCARGTIPMKRLGLQRLAAFETLEHFRHKRGLPGSGGLPDDERAHPEAIVHEYAHAYGWASNFGAESYFNVWKAATELSSEFSLSQLWITDGKGQETVEAGWQVYRQRHPTSYPSDPHLFIYSTQDGYNNTGCYDLDCSDFVQTNSSVVIGGRLSNQSQVNGSQYTTRIMVHKDGVNGHWWIAVNGVYAGYYPRNLYDSAGIINQAANIDFGGEIINSWPSGRHTGTDMGSGYKPSSGFGYAAYQRSIRYINTSNVFSKPSLTASRTKAACYDISTPAFDSGTWQTYFYFGGGGYGAGC